MYKYSFFAVSSMLGWLLFGRIGALIGLLAGGLSWLIARGSVWSAIDMLASWSSQRPISRSAYSWPAAGSSTHSSPTLEDDISGEMLLKPRL